MKRRKSNHLHWLLEFYSPVVNTDIDIFSKLITLDQMLKSSMNIKFKKKNDWLETNKATS